jgi:benzoate-CoA ligase
MPDGRNAALDILDAGGAFGAERPAYLFGEASLSYGDLRARSLRFASFLAARSIRPGDRVLLALPDTPAFAIAFLGSMLAGACPVALNTGLTAQDYAFLRSDAGAELVVTVPGHAALGAVADGVQGVCCDDMGPSALERFPADFAPRPANDALPGFMLYSSGSTGRPKGVPHRQQDLLAPAATWGTLLGLSRQDVVFSSSKCFFAYGLLASLALPLAVGASVVLFPGKPGPCDVFDVLAKYGPTAFFGVPTLYNMLVRIFEPDMRRHVPELCFSAGEALPAVLHEAWRELTGREILDGIGSTEAFNVFIANSKGASRAGFAGRAVPGFETRLVDELGNAVAPGTEGNLLVRGRGLCRGYWNRPEKTRETMLEDGWLRTGDVCVAKDGWFAHRGRSDDMLKSGGQWVSPVLVEEALLRHPAVAECAVAARQVGGLDVVCAYVVPAPGSGPEKQLSLAWRKFLRTCLPEHMCPALFVCVTELPKTATGKVQRFKLRQQ